MSVDIQGAVDNYLAALRRVSVTHDEHHALTWVGQYIPNLDQFRPPFALIRDIRLVSQEAFGQRNENVVSLQTVIVLVDAQNAPLAYELMPMFLSEIQTECLKDYTLGGKIHHQEFAPVQRGDVDMIYGYGPEGEPPSWVGFDFLFTMSLTGRGPETLRRNV